VFTIRKGLTKNKSLVKLDLSHNALDSVAGIAIAKALRDNITVAHVNLSHNHLRNPFAFELA
jgi:Ran GTPase-activating protein (RanGAP) involved in mRNA processing and transport